MRFEPLTKCRQRLSRHHIIRQVIPDLWSDIRTSQQDYSKQRSSYQIATN